MTDNDETYRCGADTTTTAGRCQRKVPHPDARCPLHPKTILEEPAPWVDDEDDGEQTDD